jgi:hypothetical protein
MEPLGCLYLLDVVYKVCALLEIQVGYNHFC